MVETVLTLPVKVKNNNEGLGKNQLQCRRYLHKSIPISGKLWQTLTSKKNLLTVKIDHNEEMYFCFISMAFWDNSLCHFVLKFSSKLPKPHYSRLFSSTECSFIKTHFPLLDDNILILTRSFEMPKLSLVSLCFIHEKFPAAGQNFYDKRPIAGTTQPLTNAQCSPSLKRRINSKSLLISTVM